MLTALPKYWKKCREVQATMDVHQQKIPYGNHPRQYSLVVKNRDPKQSIPGRYAFYFHGGAWTFGRPETFTPAAIPWLAQGFTVVLPSYRRPPAVGLNRIVADCRAAVHSFAGEAGQGQGQVIHVGGISAGAHLAAVLATEPGGWRSAGWQTTPSKVLLCGGPLSLGKLRSGKLFLPRYDHLDAIQRLATNGVEAGVAWQLIHGARDPVVHPEHSRAFLKVLKRKGATASLYEIAGGRHLDSGRWMFGGVASREVRGFLKLD